MAVRNEELFSLEHTIASTLFLDNDYPWEVLSDITEFIKKEGPAMGEDYTEIKEMVWVHKTAVVAPTASVTGPCIIGPGTEIRHCAFIRGSALIGADCVVGNSTELKNVILFDHVQVPHYNYVGDSILGYYSHMGAGSITSNVKSDKTLVVVKDQEKFYETGRKKMGAILGDYVEVGCGSVLNPGTIVGPETNIYPLSSVRGVVPPKSIYKSKSEIAEKK